MEDRADIVRKVNECLLRAARARGDEVIDVVIPFSNDDCPDYLDGLREWMSLAEPESIIVGGENCSYCRRSRVYSG